MEEYGEAADRALADGVDLNAAFAALCGLLWHSRAEASPADPCMDSNARWAAVYQLLDPEVSAVIEADALAILHAALTPAGPFVTIPKLGKAFHIRSRSDTDFNGIEILTEDGIRPGHNLVMRLQPTKHPGGHPAVPQKLIDKLDRKACATLAAAGDPLKKESRAALIRPALAAKGHTLAQGTIKNRLKAKRPLTLRARTKTRN